MNQIKPDYQIKLEGRKELFEYLKSQNVFFPTEHETRIDKRLKINIRQFGLKSYAEFLNMIKSDQNCFDTLLNWLERGKIYNIEGKSFTPLITKKRILQRKNKEKITHKMNNKSVTTQIYKKKIETTYQLHFPDPQDIENLPKLFSFLASKNINHEAYKEKYFLRRIWSRMIRNGAISYEEYLSVVKKKPMEINELLDTLSINVTRFFRDIDLFIKLERELLPIICGKKDHFVRIWSAGCAVGAEPYSLAIMVSKIVKNNLENIKIFATDICQDFLNQAKNGIYSTDLLCELNQSQIATFFNQVDQEQFRIKSNISNSVIFKRHDLRSPPPFKDLDLILCRNVLIYFSQQESEMLFKRFYNALKPGAYLVLGKCELIPSSVRHLFSNFDTSTRIYQRV